MSSLVELSYGYLLWESDDGSNSLICLKSAGVAEERLSRCSEVLCDL